MPQKTYATKDEVPESIRDTAVETKDGKFVVWEEMGDGGKAALDKERTARVAAYNAAREATAKLTELETKAKATEAGIDSKKVEELKAQLVTDLTPGIREAVLKELGITDVDAGKAKIARLSEFELKNPIMELALSKAGSVRQDRASAWWHQHGHKFELSSDGKPTVKGRPGLDVLKYISGDLKAELPELYVGSQAAGGGAGGGGGKGTQTTTSFDDLMKNPAAALTAAREAEAAA
jgi:hypothetical protein